MDTPEIRESYKAFSDRLRLLVDSRGITAKDLSRDANIPDATIYRYLNGDRVPKIDNIIAIAKFFEVSVDWILGLNDEKYETWPQATLEMARRYTVASPDDRRVVEAALEKYKGV